MTRAAAPRPGYTLLAVLVVVVVLSLAAYRFTEAMTNEHNAALRASEAAQAKTFAASGVYFAAGMLADPDTFRNTLASNPFDNQAFANVTLGPQTGGRQGGRVSLISVADTYSGSGEGRYVPRYGVTDESGKLNVNALIQQDPTGQVLYDALMKLPNMTEEIADAIVDWLDADDTQRASGAESAYYGGLTPAYLPKNGPAASLDELLLIRGVTPALLYGNDRNRNGKMDPAEADGNDFNRGWSEFLTVYGREVDADVNGNARINLNDSALDAATLSEQLTAALGQELSDYILAARLYGTSQVQSTATQTTVVLSATSGGTVQISTTTSTSGTGGSKGSGNPSSGGSSGGKNSSSSGSSSAQTVPGTADDLRAAVQNSIDTGGQLKKKVSALLALYNSQVTLPKPANSQPNTPQKVVQSPLNDTAKLKELLPKLMDAATTRTSFEIIPRVNVNTAPPEVMAAVPGLTQENIDAILAARSNLSPDDLATTTGAWLVTQANVPPAVYQALDPYITGRTMTYRVHSVGYFGKGGPVARVEAVIDTNQGHPRILYYRDVTDLGRGFDLPR